MVERLIHSVFDSSYKNVEVIVIDDLSTDDTAKHLTNTFGNKIRLIRNHRNSGVTFSRNAGIKAATGEYTFLIDDDNVLDSDCIRILASLLQSNENLLMAGPVMRYFSQPTKVWWAGTRRNMTTSKTDYLYTDTLPDEPTWPTVDFPNAWMFRTKLREYATFDESLYMHYEESDFAYSIRKKIKGDYVVAKDANIFHDIKLGDTEGVRRRWLDKKRVFYTARNRLIFHKRYSKRSELFMFLLFWNWLFIAYYVHFILGLNLGGMGRKIGICLTYIRGALVGLISKS